MPQHASETYAKIHEAGGVTLLGAMLAPNGQLIQQSTIQTIEFWLTDITDPANPVVKVTARSLTIGDVTWDTLQTDTVLWGETGGYNLKYEVPAADFDTGARLYRAAIRITPTAGNGEPFWAKWRLSALETDQLP